MGPEIYCHFYWKFIQEKESTLENTEHKNKKFCVVFFFFVLPVPSGVSIGNVVVVEYVESVERSAFTISDDQYISSYKIRFR